MNFWAIFSSFPGACATFLVSLLLVIIASTQFTRKLEELCEELRLSVGLLSLLSALGANIPNYVSSALAIFAGHTAVGIGIIIGSNIYNIAIILGLCTFFAPERNGMTLNMLERREVGVIALYALLITLLASFVILWLPDEPMLRMMHIKPVAPLLLPLALFATIGVFGTLLVHLFRRAHGKGATMLHQHGHSERASGWSLFVLGSIVTCTLVIALAGVLVMVQSGQTLTTDLGLPSVLSGLLVLAVATSLPNTVVAINLVRTGEVAASVEEICSSGSINTTLGIVVPLCFGSALLGDRFLLFLDIPCLLALTGGVLLWISQGHISRKVGVLLLVTYVVWVGLRFWVQ